MAAYGLVNSNAKWQAKLDATIIDLALIQSRAISQLFTSIDKHIQVILVTINIFDDSLVSGTDDTLKWFAI